MLATGMSHMARDSILSDDSLPEDLLAALHEFPHVPDKIPLHTQMPIPIVHQDGHHISGRNSPSHPSLVIDTTSETVLKELSSEEEGDAAKDFLDASRILRAHPGLVMAHYDPTTSVHTFKIACPWRHQDDSPVLSSPSTASLSNSSRNSSPLTSTLQTPPSGHFRRLGFVSSRGRLDSRTTFDSSDRVTYPTSSSASEFPESKHRPLRRSASELSQRPPSIGTRYMSRRLHQDFPSTAHSHSSQSPSITISSALDGRTRGSAHHMARASPGREDTSSPTSGDNLHLSDARWTPDGSIESSDQLLVFLESLSRRAQDASEARSRVTSLDPGRRHDFCEDAASDCSEYGESILSKRRYSLDEPDVLDSSTNEDLWSMLSITRAARTWDSSDNYSLLVNGDTFLDLHARSSSPASQLQPESPNCSYPHVSHLRPPVDPHPQRSGSQNPVTTASLNPEKMQDTFPNLLDLRVGLDLPGSVTDGVLSRSGDMQVSLPDERPALVPESSSADPQRLEGEGERSDPTPAQQSPVTSHGPRKVKSAAELVSSHFLPTQPLPPRQDDHRGYNHGTGLQAEYSELAHSQSKAEPDNLWRGNSYRVKQLQDRRTREGQHHNPGSSVIIDSRSRSESRSREASSASQRHRAMTLQEVAVTGSSTLRRSATTMTSAPSMSSFRTGVRYRTLEDRAYHHPDVPHSPLCSDMDHGPSAQGAHHTGPSLREPSHGHGHNFQVSSPEAGHIPHIHSRKLSSGGVYSRNASPRPPVPRPHMPPSHSRNESYPAGKRPGQAHVHRPGSSLDSRTGSSLSIVPLPSVQGVGLSLIDNGAFEAPRPAPEPRTLTHEKANASLRPVVQQVAPPAAAKEPSDDSPRQDSSPVVVASLTGLGAFPRRVWSKRQKQPPPRLDGLRRGLGSANNSELDLKSLKSSSFISMVENEHEQVKPQRKRLLSFKRK